MNESVLLWKVEKAVKWALDIAADDSHGYSQYNRWGNPDYDCSSFVISAFEQAGIPLKTNGATYTGNMLAVCKKCGFKAVNINDRKRGDILLNVNHHTAIYLGDGKLVHASRDENGGIAGKNGGDNDGKEICVRTYYSYPWNYCLRYEEASTNEPNTNSKATGGTNVNTRTIKQGMQGEDVRSLQILLNSKNNAGLKTDGIAGALTCEAIKNFQKVKGLVPDAIAGEKTWNAIIN